MCKKALQVVELLEVARVLCFFVVFNIKLLLAKEGGELLCGSLIKERIRRTRR